jgi:hypothetical protein
MNDRLPITDRGIVRAIREGRVITRSDVESLQDGIARFSDRRQPDEPVDAVVFATGFRRVSPLLPDAGTREDSLLFQLFHRREPGLTYMTEVVGLRSCWPIYVEQARALAAYYVAEAAGGPRVAAFNARRDRPSPNCKGKLFRLADEFHLDHAIYARLLRDFVEWISASPPGNEPDAAA